MIVQHIATPPPAGFVSSKIEGDTITYYFEDDIETINYKKARHATIMEMNRANNKSLRLSKVNSLTVTTVAGNTFNGDETSQQRMARAVSVLYANELIQWTMADNSVDFITREELAEALRLAVFKQTQLWQLPE